MTDEYLKKDMERINKRFTELMNEGEIEVLENKIDDLNNKSSLDSIDQIWLEIYNDVLDMKKKEKYGINEKED